MARIEAAFDGSVGGDDEIDGGVGRNGAGPLDIEIGFSGGVVGAVGIVDAVDAGIVAVDDDLGRIGGKAEEGAELIDEIDVDIGVVDDGDGLAGAVDVGVIERVEIVLDGKVSGRENVVFSAAVAPGPLRNLVGGGFNAASPSFLT